LLAAEFLEQSFKTSQIIFISLISDGVLQDYLKGIGLPGEYLAEAAIICF
jgi:hypothetical protein